MLGKYVVSVTFPIVSMTKSHHPPNYAVDSLVVRTRRQCSWSLGSIPNLRQLHSPIAQLAVRGAVNSEVVRSSRTGGVV